MDYARDDHAAGGAGVAVPAVAARWGAGVDGGAPLSFKFRVSGFLFRGAVVWRVLR